MDALDVVKLRAHRKPGALGHPFVGGELDKLENPGGSHLAVADGGLLKALDAADGVGGLVHGNENIAHALALDGLDVAVSDQAGDGPPQGVAGTAVYGNQGVFRGQQLSLRKFS